MNYRNKQRNKVQTLVNVYYGQQADRQALGDLRRTMQLDPETADTLITRIEDTMAEIEQELSETAHRLECGKWASSYVGIVLAAALVDGLGPDLWPQQAIWSICGLSGRTGQRPLTPRAAILYLDEEFPGKTVFSPTDIESIREQHRIPIDPASTLDRDAVIRALTQRPYSGFLHMVATRISTVLSRDCKNQWGKLYEMRLRFEDSMNQRGLYSKQAAEWLERSSRVSSANYYADGKLPPWHIIGRARRFVAKAFLERFIIMRREEELGESLPDDWVPLDLLPESKWGPRQTEGGEEHA